MTVCVRPADEKGHTRFEFMPDTPLGTMAHVNAIMDTLQENRLYSSVLKRPEVNPAGKKLERGDTPGFYAWEVFGDEVDVEMLQSLLPEVAGRIHDETVKLRAQYPQDRYPDMYIPADFTFAQQDQRTHIDILASAQMAQMDEAAREVNDVLSRFTKDEGHGR